jgi:hypothetical protein
VTTVKINDGTIQTQLPIIQARGEELANERKWRKMLILNWRKRVDEGIRHPITTPSRFPRINPRIAKTLNSNKRVP